MSTPSYPYVPTLLYVDLYSGCTLPHTLRGSASREGVAARSLPLPHSLPPLWVITCSVAPAPGSGTFISPGGVRSIWLRHDLETLKKRLKVSEAQDDASTEAQLQTLERVKEEK